MIHLKRAYEPLAKSDGYRVLVERLWPRGLRKGDAHLDAWLKDIAPSSALRTWFGHDPSRWSEFRERYRRELRSQSARDVIDDLVRRSLHSTVTLVYAAHDQVHNSAIVLAEEIAQRAEPRPHARGS